MKPGNFRDFGADELMTKERELNDQLFRMRIQKSMGQLEAPELALVSASGLRIDEGIRKVGGDPRARSERFERTVAPERTAASPVRTGFRG